MTTRLKSLSDWVAQVAELTSPDRIYWCEGTEQEYRKLIEEMLDSGSLLELNQQHYPGCYLHRSDPEDVARVEHLTFICTKNKEDAGPNNHWMDPLEAHRRIDALFDGSMRGRTLYVVPYCMIDEVVTDKGVDFVSKAFVTACLGTGVSARWRPNSSRRRRMPTCCSACSMRNLMQAGLLTANR